MTLICHELIKFAVSESAGFPPVIRSSGHAEELVIKLLITALPGFFIFIYLLRIYCFFFNLKKSVFRPLP